MADVPPYEGESKTKDIVFTMLGQSILLTDKGDTTYLDRRAYLYFMFELRKHFTSVKLF